MQTYLIINVALCLSYLLLRPILKLLQQHLSQQQHLHLIRRVLASILIIFLCMPWLASLRPLSQPLDINPLLLHAPAFISTSATHLQLPAATVQASGMNISPMAFFTIFIAAGIIFYALRNLRDLYNLQQLKRSAFHTRTLGRVSILVSESTTAACCFSLLWRHYIVIPAAIIIKPAEMRISIKHEIQHLRQRDTYWLHLLSWLSVGCFWNPAVKRWVAWCKETQEFACDEALALREKNSLADYAQCLVNAARISTLNVLAMNGGSTTHLYRRVNMLFKYKPVKRKLLNSVLYGISLICITSGAYAVNNLSTPLSARDVNALLKPAYAQAFHITAEPEVINRLNFVRSNKAARDKMLAALERMEQYKPAIQAEMKKRDIPNDFLAMPLLQSGYKPLPEAANPAHAAGIWQIIPQTARNLGLVVHAKRDDRLDTQLSTRAALSYLQALYEQFHDWKLAALAYEIGEHQTAQLMKTLNTTNAWDIARSDYFTKPMQEEVTKYLAVFDADVIILHNRGLLKG